MKLFKIVWMEDEVQQCFIWTLKEEDLMKHFEAKYGYIPRFWESMLISPEGLSDGFVFD